MTMSQCGGHETPIAAHYGPMASKTGARLVTKRSIKESINLLVAILVRHIGERIEYAALRIAGQPI
jgi:hypothetical protein